ncbi:ribonuclease P protein component [Dokdonella sp.]|uniref:ribonuclease P protein component n=1 Tax=Dokdonella sp. TaxID=2291710 RepID=UPI003783D237
MARATFPRDARLLTARDFARLRTCSRRVSSRNLIAEVAASETTGVRMGLAVSRKVSRKAVRRNRIKRIARDSFRRHRAMFPALDILVIARSSADLQDNPALHAEFAQLWQRIVALNVTGAAGTMRD